MGTKCRYSECDHGWTVVGWREEEKITKDMALAAGNPLLEGLPLNSGDYIWDACPCCGGSYEDCKSCERWLGDVRYAR